MKLLLVDDDKQFVTQFKNDFAHQFSIISGDANEVRAYQKSGQLQGVDAVVIDLLMPDIDGISLWRELKSSVPIGFILSESYEAKHRELALEWGLIDYLHKEMSPTEIALRIQRRVSALNKSENVDQSQISSGNMELDLEKMNVCLGSQTIDLTKTEFRILRSVLMGEQSKVKRDQLMRGVWGDRKVVRQTLNTHIFNLNEKLKAWDQFLSIDKDEDVLVKPRQNS